MYQDYHRYMTKVKDFKVSEGFYDEINDIKIDNQEDFEFSPNYRQIVSFAFYHNHMTCMQIFR